MPPPDVGELDDRLFRGEDNWHHRGRLGTIGERRCSVCFHESVTLGEVDEVEMYAVGTIDHLHQPTDDVIIMLQC